MSRHTLRNFIAVAGISALADTSSATAPATPLTPTADASGNTAVGRSALLNLGTPSVPITAFGNTAVGNVTLVANTTGFQNTATGDYALNQNTTGADNTATGAYSLWYNTTGSNNTATGHHTLAYNLTGNNNTANGNASLGSNTSGNYNVGIGALALLNNTTGASNSAVGASAMHSNTTGANNTALGYLALYSNVSGKGNAAQGVNALYDNTTGIRNAGIGNNALFSNTTGSYNIGLGFEAGYNVTTGSNNIEIGAPGTSGDNNTIQIGVQGTQTYTAIAGIHGTTLTGSAVYVTATGQLGVLGSSERFKTDIATMPELTDKLGRLRPVTFHYKTDPKGIQQYGLIAEEVDKVYPELVIRDDKGTIQGVRYEELAPMLLNEVQKQQQVNAAQSAKIAALEQKVAEVDALKQQLSEVMQELKARDKLLAQR